VEPAWRTRLAQAGSTELQRGFGMRNHSPGKYNFESLLTRATLLGGTISGWMIFAMMILTTVAVLTRRVFFAPLTFSDEYSAYLLVFCVFFGGAYTLHRDDHVRVDVIAIRLKFRTRILFRLITSFFSFLYGSILTWKTIELVIYYKKIGHKALSIAETPTWIPALVVPIGMALLTLQMVLCILQDARLLKTGNSAIE